MLRALKQEGFEVGVGTAPSISARNLRLIYNPDSDPLVAIDQVSLDVQEHEFVSFVGPSGCGKTTLLRLIAGLVSPSEGSLSVEGTPVSGPLRRIGIVFQVPALMKWRTTLQNVLYPAEILRMPRKESRDRATFLLDLVGLSGFEGKYPHELSGGMQQRVGIARALMHDPTILLLDEPFGALDAMTRGQLNLELQRIWSERRKTSVLITHSITEAVFLSDRVFVFSPRPGRIIEEVAIPLARPRVSKMKSEPEFIQLVDRISSRIGMDFL